MKQLTLFFTKQILMENVQQSVCHISLGLLGLFTQAYKKRPLLNGSEVEKEGRERPDQRPDLNLFKMLQHMLMLENPTIRLSQNFFGQRTSALNSSTV